MQIKASSRGHSVLRSRYLGSLATPAALVGRVLHDGPNKGCGETTGDKRSQIFIWKNGKQQLSGFCTWVFQVCYESWMDLRSSTILFQTFSPHHRITTSPVSDCILSVVTCVLPDCGRELSKLLQIMTKRNLNTYVKLMKQQLNKQRQKKKQKELMIEKKENKTNWIIVCFRIRNFLLA